ncbi:MAG: rhomboid family intramembrane serine protease [Bacteroidales bacterium]|nr:rhomboid family intramembrane serine protease [Bacteroidales bacterium]
MKDLQIEKSKNTDAIRFKISISFALIFVAIMWIIKIFEETLGYSFAEFGVYPQTFAGLNGIIFSPFLHGDFNHLFSNTFPILILLTALIYFYPKNYFRIFIITYISSGIILWFIGRPSYHIGASGLIYAFAAFHFFSGVLSRRNDFIALSLIVVFLYGGIIWGVFPGIDETISWEGHLAGFAVGTFLSIFFHPKENILLQNSRTIDLKNNFIYFYDFKTTNSNVRNETIYRFVDKETENEPKTYNYQIKTNETFFNNYPTDFHIDDNFWTT